MLFDRILSITGAVTGILALLFTVWTYKENNRSKLLFNTSPDNSQQDVLIESYLFSGGFSPFFRESALLYITNFGGKDTSIHSIDAILLESSDGPLVKYVNINGEALQLPISVPVGNTVMVKLVYAIQIPKGSWNDLRRKYYFEIQEIPNVGKVLIPNYDSKKLQVGDKVGKPTWDFMLDSARPKLILPEYRVSLKYAGNVQVQIEFRRGQMLRTSESR